ncbi:unnamed protein product [Dovyalis caffra]|uniref:F-box protein n=1 Tax=Dovyalis caffra TaxID=77055 RepID=A0AAV1SFN7_9ROSI|nr:unnamed protein product [Dovyalis caffra]
MEASQETKQHMVVNSDEEGSTSIHDLPSYPYFPVSYAANGPTQLLIPIVHRSSDTVCMVDCDSQDCPARKIDIGVAGKGGPPLMLTEKHTAILVKSSCNGFLSLCDKESGNPVSLWNPMLCEYVLLPEVTRASSYLSVSSTVISGLGFADKKYKVVCYELSARFCGTNFNGIRHWNIEGHASELIYCLDVRNEKFSCLPSPPIISTNKNRRDYYWSDIGVLEDFLYISARSASDLVPSVQVWLMKEYGFKESWIRILNIKSPLEDLWNIYRRFKLIKVLSDGNIVLLCGDHSLLVCEPRNQSYRHVFHRSDPMIAVSPSFVSLENVA